MILHEEFWPYSYQIKRYAKKGPEFDATYGLTVTKSKGMQKKVQNFTQHMTL